ncbi:DUF4817 domain-containing protein [Trichonephila clavipes]|nr:DUF4817 domain-containing protein [Trichonephila clavipes]
MGLRFGESGGQATGVLCSACILRYITWRWLRIAIGKCAGTPSCMNHTFRCALAGTSCSNSGRSGKLACACRILQPYYCVPNPCSRLATPHVCALLVEWLRQQNCRIWSEANPQVYVETPLHPEKLTVWCTLWAGGIIGPYFFKNDEGHNVTVNGDRYRAMITNVFIPELNNQDVQELWFQQDGATCHTARATIDLLKDTFGDRLISRFRPVNWPPRSCDLTPLDYFLWG